MLGLEQVLSQQADKAHTHIAEVLVLFGLSLSIFARRTSPFAHCTGEPVGPATRQQSISGQGLIGKQIWAISRCFDQPTQEQHSPRDPRSQHRVCLSLGIKEVIMPPWLAPVKYGSVTLAVPLPACPCSRNDTVCASQPHWPIVPVTGSRCDSSQPCLPCSYLLPPSVALSMAPA